MEGQHFAKTNMTSAERSYLVLELTLQGRPTLEIRQALGGVTRQRVHQIQKALIRDGRLSKEQLFVQQQKKKRIIQYFDKWGHSKEERSLRESDLYQAMRTKFRSKKGNTHGHEFTVSFGELTFPTHCPILGVALDYFAETQQDNSVSFDRTDPSKGYISGNVTIISQRANRIKNNGTADEHEKIAKYMREQLKQVI